MKGENTQSPGSSPSLVKVGSMSSAEEEEEEEMHTEIPIAPTQSSKRGKSYGGVRLKFPENAPKSSIVYHIKKTKKDESYDVFMQATLLFEKYIPRNAEMEINISSS